MDLKAVATPEPEANSAKVISGPAPHARKMDRSLAHRLAWPAGNALPQYSLPGLLRVGKHMIKSIDPRFTYR